MLRIYIRIMEEIKDDLKKSSILKVRLIF